MAFRHALAPPVLLLLAACADVPTEVAEAQCQEEAERGVGLGGRAAIGVGSGGFIQDVDVTFTLRSDAARTYEDCVVRKTGSAPTRPYWSR